MEVKDNAQFEFLGNKLWVRYGSIKESTSDQADRQKFALRDYISRETANRSPFVYSTVWLRPANGGDISQIPALDKWIRAQPQMQLQAVPETKYYADQAGPLAIILKGLAAFVAFVMGVGAVFGAMNTMYAIVASRTREIGTLRALGFSRLSILSSFVMESVFLATLAGAIGCLLALPMNGFSTGTAQTQSFSEVAFSFQLTPAILITGMVFAALMGLVGGLLPALRAARMPITRALRDA